MTREKKEKLIRHLKYNREIGADYLITDEDADEIIKALEQEPCSDAISRQAVLDYIDEMPSDLTADGRRMIRRRTLEEYISDTLPPVTPQPKTGHWIDAGSGQECSECGSVHDTATNYCPDCGCLMDRTEFDEYVKTEGA